MKPPPTLSELGALLPWAHFEVDAGEIVIYTGLELDDDEETTLWMSGVESPHWSPGRWVPWCVAHDTRGGAGSHYCDDPDSEPNSCRWHPQGAFIPAVEDVLPAVDVDDPVREALLDLRRRHRGVNPKGSTT